MVNIPHRISLSQIWFRIYIYCTGYPSGSLRIVECEAGGTLCGGIALTSAGKIECVDNAGLVAPTSTNVINENGWTRVEGYVIGSTTAGSIQYKIFLTPDSTTPTETETSATNLNTGSSSMTLVRFGNPTSVPSYTFYMDDLGVSDTAYLGPSIITGAIGTAALTLTATATGSSQRSGATTGAVSLSASAAGPASAPGHPRPPSPLRRPRQAPASAPAHRPLRCPCPRAPSRAAGSPGRSQAR